MNRRGFALITVLWVLAAVSGLIGAGLVLVRTGVTASSNRIHLLRAEHARAACEEILQGRFRAAEPLRQLNTVDLGRGVWCSAEVWDPSVRLPLNIVDESQLGLMLRSVMDSARADSLVQALMDWRDADSDPRPWGAEVSWYRGAGRRPPRNGPLADVRELRYVRGFTDRFLDTLETWLTVRSDGRVNLNGASPKIMVGIAGLTHSAAAFIVKWRERRGAVGSHEQLADALNRAQMPLTFDRYREFVRGTTLTTNRIVARLEAGVEGTPLRSRAVVTYAIVDGGLVVLRRELR